MTEAYRVEELSKARIEAAAARDRWMKTKKRKDADNLEFWTNKVSFLSAVRADS